MAIKRPDIYKHNNPAYSIADSDFIRGGFRTGVADLTALYSLDPSPSTPDQFKEHSTIVYVSGETKYYVLVDITNISNASGWNEFQVGGSSARITGGTNGLSTLGANIVLGGDLTGNTTINADNNDLLITNVNDFQVSTSGSTNLIGVDTTGILLSTSGSSVSMETSEGLIYGGDYNSNNPKWIPTKSYVDGVAIGLNLEEAVYVATTNDDGNLPLSGDSGTIDGFDITGIISTNNRILVKNQIDESENGIYSANTGDWGRTNDYDFSPADEIANGDLIPVITGDTQYNSLWAQTVTNPIASGDSLTFTLFNLPIKYIAGTGIDITTNIINVDGASLAGNSISWTGTSGNETFNVDITTGTLSTALNNKLDITDFNSFTGTTLPNNYYNKTEINSYTAATDTLIDTKLDTTIFTTYTAATDTIIINAITGGTNIGGGNEIFSGASQHIGYFRTIVGTGTTIVSTVDDKIIVSGTCNIGGATNGIQHFSGDTYFGLGGELIQDTTIYGAYVLNLGNVASGLTAISAITPTFRVGSANGNSSINFLHDEDTPHYDVCLYGQNANSNANIVLDVDINDGCFIVNTAPNNICKSNLSLKTTNDNTAIFNVSSINDSLIYNNEAWISSSCRMTCESIINIFDSALNIKSIMNYDNRSFTFSIDNSTILDILSGGTARYGSNVVLNNDCDLVHKWYVDNAAGSISGSNGLTRVDDNITLGGTLTGNTCIDGDSYGLTLSGLTHFCVDSQLGNFNVISMSVPSSTIYQEACNICAVLGDGNLDLYDNIGNKQIELAVGGDIRFCNLTAKTTETDVVYINSSTGRLVSGATINTVTANNGLCKIGDNIVLGGDLTGNTTINGLDTHNLTLDNINNLSLCSNSVTTCATTEMLIRTPNFSLHNGINNVMLITSSCNILTDTTNSKGFAYADDYSISGSTNPRWIPDNEYVTGLTSNFINTASNGLIKTGTDIKLGGSLCEDTNICLGGLTPYSFLIKNSGTTTCSVGDFNSTSINLCVSDVNSPYQSGKICTTFNNTIISNGFTNCYSCVDLANASINIMFCGNNSSFIVTDATTTQKGIEYAADYSDTFVNESLITKRYADNCVDSSISGITSTVITGATNGLTKDGQDVKLGGILSETTTISGGSQTINFGTDTSQIGFNICGSLISDGAIVSLTGDRGDLYMDTCCSTLSSCFDSTNFSKICVNQQGIAIDFGSNNTESMWYCGDYSNNFTLRSIPDVAYVTGLTSSIETDLSQSITGATNGLTKTGQDVELGGTLITDTVINLNNGNCFQLCDTGLATSYIFDNTGVTLNNNNSIFKIGNTGNNYKLTHCSGSNVNLSLSGLTYGGNYESNFNPHTLVTKNYVDNATGGIDANNGLTRQGDNIVLGGALTGDTNISGTDILTVSSPYIASDVQYMIFDKAPSISGHVEGRLYYNNCQLNFDREVSGVTTQLGEEQVVRVENKTGDLIPNGSVVYVNGVSLESSLPTVALADAVDFEKATQTIGITTQDISNNNEGYVTVLGVVHDVNTNGFAEGTLLWLSTTSGTFTDIRPDYPNYSVSIGIVTKTSTSDGEIYVKILYVPNYTEYGLFTGYTASTNTALDLKLDTSIFNSYSSTTNNRLDVIEEVTDIALTGATNGLCAFDGRNVTLGGSLTQTTTISGDYDFTVGTSQDICLVTTETKNIGFNTKSNGSIYMKSQSGTVDGSDMTDAVGITLDYNGGVGMLVTDNRPTPRGLEYKDNYSLTYNNHSLVDKYYVDSIATGLNVIAATYVATTNDDGNLSLSGDSGIIDDVAVSTIISENNRILVKNQTDLSENGIYSASTGNWGRTDDYDFSPTNEISNGDLIPVIYGTDNGNSQWINISTNPISSGDSIIFSIFTKQQGVVEGDGICVITDNNDKAISVKLYPSNCGLTFDSTALKLDYNVFRYGLTTNITTGYVDVNACISAPISTAIPVRMDTGDTSALYVDRNDFSYTTAANGLSKVGCDVILGGVLCTGTTVCGGGIFDLNFTELNAFSLGFDGGAVITDSATTPHGICYASDYRSGFVDLSLVDKRFVNNAITGSTLTYCDGLTKTDKIIQWGGDMTTDRALIHGGTNFCVKSTGIDIINNCACVLTANAGINLRTCDNTNGCDSSIGLTDTGIMSIVASNATQGLTITSAAHGAVYAGDYENNFVNRSLVTKQYVTGLTSAIETNVAEGITGATNGLTKDGQDVCLGGTLDTATVFTKNGTGSLLKYAADYSSEYDAQTIPDAEYVTGLTSQSIVTSSNGLTKTGQDIKLGGSTPLSETTNICGANNDLNIGTAASKIGVLNLNTASVAVLSTGNTEICPTGILTLDGSAISINEVASYDTDKSGLYTLRSLVDKEYVDGEINSLTGTTSQSITGAINGITKTGQDVKLGGELTENTTILGSGYSINFGTGVSQISDFTADGSNTIQLTGDRSNLFLDTCEARIASCFDASNFSEICLDQQGIKVTVCGTDGHMFYADDYSSTYTNRSIVDKEYIDNKANVVNVCQIGSTYTTLRNDELIAVSGLSTNQICLYATPVIGQRLTVVDICGNALADPITVNGNGNNINDAICSTINTDYGSVTYVFNGIFWSAVAFIN
jgi:hypothetical protein